MKNFFAKSLLALAIAGASASTLATEIVKLDYDQWADSVVEFTNGDKGQNINFWVDMAIENLGYNKDVTVVWTSNDWATWHETPAFYEGTLVDGREQWGADILEAGTVSTRYYGTFWEHNYDYSENSTDWLDGNVCDSATESCSVNVRFALRYIDLETGVEYWDNNNGDNYTIVLTGSTAE